MDFSNLIPHKDNHLTYDHTFLNRVIVQISYDCDIKSKYEDFKLFFKDFSGLDLSEANFNKILTEPVRIKTDDNNLFFKIDFRFIQLKIEGEIYKNFKTSVLPFLNKIFKLLSEIKASIGRIEIRKINIWGYNQSESTASGHEFMKSVFSPQLLNNWNPIEGRDRNQSVEMTRIEWDEEYGGLKIHPEIVFGFIESNAAEELSRIVLDTVCEMSVAKDVLVQSGDLALMNSRLYDIYHWAVSDATLNAMK